jgi:putative MATE family efflux protein
MEKTNLYASASIPKLLVNACIPAVITTLVVTLYHIADTFFIGQTGDAMQVAAITLSGPVYSILSGLGTLIGSGGCAAIAIALGKKNHKQAKSLSSFCCYSAIAVGIVFALGITLGMPAILKILNVTQETRAHTRNYIQIISLGAPFLLFSSIFANVVRGEGAIKESLLGNGIGSIINIMLDPVLILNFKMGITGAAIATVIGNMVSALYFVSFITGKKSQLSLNIKHFSIQKNIAWQTISLGLPTALGIAIMSVYGIVSNHVIGRYGDIAIAASGVSGKLGMIIAMIHIGICMGIQPALAYNYGASNMARFIKIGKGTALVTICTGTILSCIGWLMRSGFLSAFLQNAEVISYGEKFIIAGIVTGSISGLCYLSTSILQATEKVKWATCNALLRQGILSIPLLLILSTWVGLTGIVITGIIVDIVAAVIGVIISIWQLHIPSDLHNNI